MTQAGRTPRTGGADGRTAGEAASPPGPVAARRRLVCKAGGSLMDGGWAPGVVDALARVSPPLDVLLVAGGGRAADRVRARFAAGELSEEEAHWAAVRALDGTALRLAGGCGRDLPLSASLPPLHPGLSVIPPRAALRSENPMPHSWAVTSDSIAAWCALRSGARDLLLLKARGAAPRPVDGRPRATAREASAAGIVDDHLPELLADAPLRTWIVDGRHPRRLLRRLAGDPRAATRLEA